MDSNQKYEKLEEFIAKKRMRLRCLQEDYEKAMAAGKILKAIKIIGAARREMEGPPIRHRKKSSQGLR